MKKGLLLAITAISSLVSVSAHAVSEIRCQYQLNKNWQTIVIDHQIPHRNAKSTVPFLLHRGDVKFGTYDIQAFPVSDTPVHLKNWTYVKAYSDIVDSTFDLDIENGKISIERQGKMILKNARLSCKFNQGGE